MVHRSSAAPAYYNQPLMIRVISIALAFVALTLVLLPFQLIGLAFDLRLRRTVPHLYHRMLCVLIGVRIREVGTRSTASPMLILSNHVSWLDICVITALAPVVFVAKSEVATWPLFGWLAKLQRTIFINRKARHQTGAATREIAGRLLGGDAVVLFAEGTSSDGVRVLPFRSSLVGAVHHALGATTQHSTSPCNRCRWPMSASAACRWDGPCASGWRGTATPN